MKENENQTNKVMQKMVKIEVREKGDQKGTND